MNRLRPWLLLFLCLVATALPALDFAPSSAFVGQQVQPQPDAAGVRTVLGLNDPSWWQSLTTNQQFLTFLSTNAAVATALASNTYLVTLLASNDVFTTSLAGNNTFIVNISQNPVVASNLVQAVPEKWHGLLTQSQTNHVFDDVRKRDVFTVASGVTLTLAADSTNAVQPTWGYAYQGGYASYRLAGSAVVVDPTHFVFLTPVPATATNGTVSCSQFGNSVLFGFCPTNGP